MSRVDVARAALRSLASPNIDDEAHRRHRRHDSSSSSSPVENRLGDTHSHHSPASFFGNGANAQLTDSPTNSPSLAPTHSPIVSYREFGISSSSGPHHAAAYGAWQAASAGMPPPPSSYRRPLSQVRTGSYGTPGSIDVPSLSLSNSSFSESHLQSPYHEGLPPSTSSSRVRAHPQGADAAHSGGHGSPKAQQRYEAMRCAAAALRMPFEEVQRSMSSVRDLGGWEAVAENSGVVADDTERDALRRIVDTVRAEEERLVQIASFRAAYMQTEAKRTVMELQHRPPAAAQEQQQRWSTSLIGQAAVVPPLSPPPSYEHLEVLDRDDYHGQVLSPREALTLLSSSGRFREEDDGGAHHHARRPSNVRPLSLPDRSYHSMDDYTSSDSLPHFLQSPSRRNSRNAGYLRRSMQAAPYPTASSSSRNASRSPRISDSPHLVSSFRDLNVGDYGGPATSPLLTTTNNRLTPGGHTVSSRRRSASNTSNRSSIVSRRASTDVLGLGLPRSASPMDEASVSLSTKLSHEEVMARLQRKVRERIAAREAANASGGGAAATTASASVSPSVEGLGVSTPSGRRRQGSASGGQLPLSASSLHASSSQSRLRKPRKSASLKTLPQDKRKSYDVSEEKSLPPLPVHATQNRTLPPLPPKDDDDEDRMSGVEHEERADADIVSGRRGIEALLSAAAIAESGERRREVY